MMPKRRLPNRCDHDHRQSRTARHQLYAQSPKEKRKALRLPPKSQSHNCHDNGSTHHTQTPSRTEYQHTPLHWGSIKDPTHNQRLDFDPIQSSKTPNSTRHLCAINGSTPHQRHLHLSGFTSTRQAGMARPPQAAYVTECSE